MKRIKKTHYIYINYSLDRNTIERYEPNLTIKMKKLKELNCK